MLYGRKIEYNGEELFVKNRSFTADFLKPRYTFRVDLYRNLDDLEPVHRGFEIVVDKDYLRDEKTKSIRSTDFSVTDEQLASYYKGFVKEKVGEGKDLSKLSGSRKRKVGEMARDYFISLKVKDEIERDMKEIESYITGQLSQFVTEKILGEEVGK